MSTHNIHASFSEFQAELETRIQEKKKGKIEITNSDYAKLQVLRFVIVAGNGAFNALYGWSLGYNILSCVLLAVVMFSGDWALSLLHQITSSTKTAYAYSGFVTKAGLIFLSLVAGTSFMLGIKHAQDVKSSRVGELQEELEVNKEKFRELGLTRTATRIRLIQAELNKERERVGANFSAANAFPMYLAKVSGYNYEAVSLGLNVLWIAVLLFTGMSLSAQLGMVWCPKKAKAVGKEITEALLAQAKLEEAHLKALQRRQRTAFKVQAMVEQSHKLQGQEKDLRKHERQQGSRASKRAPTRDTGTSGKLGARYNEVVKAVREGKLKPSLSKIRSFARCGSNTAHSYLKQLALDGVIYRNGQGFKA